MNFISNKSSQMPPVTERSGLGLNVCSIFSGIGGIEIGLEQAGHTTVSLCEADTNAQTVLNKRFPNLQIHQDILTLDSIPDCDLVSAGFPCQDLSQAGTKQGISGNQSGLVTRLFSLLNRRKSKRPNWILIENVPYMLKLDNSKAMHYLTGLIESVGYRWAYRVVDTRSFGLPQRRARVILLAALDGDPRDVLLADESRQEPFHTKPSEISEDSAYGFYWTEGKRGAGWVVEGVPPIKGGSGLGIPSPPALWFPSRNYVCTPSIRDAERLQGFPEGWTDVDFTGKKRSEGVRWKLVGNAVSTPVFRWVGCRLTKPESYNSSSDVRLTAARWPSAGWGQCGEKYASNASMFPIITQYQKISSFLKHPTKPLSKRATLGFLSRAKVSTEIVYSERFFESLEAHADNWADDQYIG
ncbi:DNA (cytosine-5-)-methyltransferase [Paracoccaceae bacterium]|nr:DNA (cytosine-5-)-methyltransferase [Paracoccaceae bacterium]